MKPKQLLEVAGVLMVVAVVELGFFLFAGSFSAYALWLLLAAICAAVARGVATGVRSLLTRSAQHRHRIGQTENE